MLKQLRIHQVYLAKCQLDCDIHREEMPGGRCIQNKKKKSSELLNLLFFGVRTHLS